MCYVFIWKECLKHFSVLISNTTKIHRYNPKQKLSGVLNFKNIHKSSELGLQTKNFENHCSILSNSSFISLVYKSSWSSCSELSYIHSVDEEREQMKRNGAKCVFQEVTPRWKAQKSVRIWCARETTRNLLQHKLQRKLRLEGEGDLKLKLDPRQTTL